MVDDFVTAQDGFENGFLSSLYGKCIGLKALRVTECFQECFARAWFPTDQWDVVGMLSRMLHHAQG